MMRAFEEAARCLLCKDASCTQSCKNSFDPARAIRAVKFKNQNNAGIFINGDVCANCDGDCEKACIHYDEPLRIKEIIKQIPDCKKTENIDLSIDFLGVHCENPFFLSSSIVASNYEMCARALEMGWGGIVYKTIGFLKPEEVSPRFDALKNSDSSFSGFKNLEQISEKDLSENLEILKNLKEDYPTKIIVASILGQTDEEWAELTKRVTEIGVDMIECNFSCPHMSAHGLGSDVGQNPDLVARYTSIVKSHTTLPVLAKMTPNLGNMEIPAIAAVEAGADGLAAINTVKSITGIDLEISQPKMSVVGKSAVSGYSGNAVKPIALRFISDMAKCEQLKGIPISGMGGIETWCDAAEFIELGCSNIQITTAVMQYGYRIIDDLISGLSDYMASRKIDELSDLVGIALDNIVSTETLDRETIVYPKFNRETCVGCGRCFISCDDAGHQALLFDVTAKRPILNAQKCAGCLLCSLVCPANAIELSKRIPKLK